MGHPVCRGLFQSLSFQWCWTHYGFLFFAEGLEPNMVLWCRGPASSRFFMLCFLRCSSVHRSCKEMNFSSLEPVWPISFDISPHQCDSALHYCCSGVSSCFPDCFRNCCTNHRWPAASETPKPAPRHQQPRHSHEQVHQCKGKKLGSIKSIWKKAEVPLLDDWR